MGRFGGFYKGEKKKQKKKGQKNQAQSGDYSSARIVPVVEIIKKGKNED